MPSSVSDGGGRLEVVLDRSWEVQSITWSNLTWWDPLPCGQELLSSIKTSDPLPQPSPALSLIGHPPTPRRKLPPTHLSFRSTSTSPSPIPPRTNTRYSFGDPRSYSSSPLAWALPPSPESYNSVFLHSDSSSPSYPFPCTPPASPPSTSAPPLSISSPHHQLFPPHQTLKDISFILPKHLNHPPTCSTSPDSSLPPKRQPAGNSSLHSSHPSSLLLLMHE